MSKHLTICPPPSWPQSMAALIEAQPEIGRAIVARLQQIVKEERDAAERLQKEGIGFESGLAALKAVHVQSAIYAIEAVIFEQVLNESVKQRSGEGDALHSDAEK